MGNTIILGGVVTSGIGALNALNDNDMNTAFIIGGGILSLTGLVFIIESHIHIKRAGILLNENGVGVKLYL